MSVVYKEFNRAVKAMIKDLLIAFPDADLLKLSSCYFAMLKRINKKKPQRYFYKVTEVPHGSSILERDIEYFKSDRFQSPDWRSLVNWIKEKLCSMDKENVDRLFDHLLVLMALSKRCQAYETSKVSGVVNNDSDGEEDED